ncbi:MAG: hypothetical protein PHS17_04205, partial [Desulfobacterales bacterium]|nr:hypothetical protein [Desulfobacterales bacterium]
MNIKRYIAGTVQEALQMVKREMGPEAVILETKTIQSTRGAARAGKRVQVTAAMDYDPRPIAATAAEGPDLQEVLERYRYLEAELKEIKSALLLAEAGNLMNPEIRYNRGLKTRYLNFRRFGLMPEMIDHLLEEGGT